ncbi:transporter [Microbacterium mangrovi]|uniref:Transporter n=1 Tax=Microbacterium mangrovi TaxID=1348253 RepID=A0A0B2A930_9MICO|nr:MMPL family transporter [Microbacterium mangrovi]KHK98052.1 transporter [Microbacterium mangrovi]
MSTLLYSLGRWSYRHPWRVLVSWILLLLLAGGGVALFAKGTDNSFSIPGTESQEGIAQLNRTFPQAAGTNAQFIVVAAPGDSVRDEPYTSDIKSTIDGIGKLDGVLGVTDPYSKYVTGLISHDDSAAIVQMQFKGQVTDVKKTTKDDLTAATEALQNQLPAGSTVSLGGDLFAQSLPTISIIEAVGLLIALVVLVVTFRSFVVAGLPLVTALLGVGLSMALIFLATAFATISATTPMLALMLGLAVGIDYALFIIARHQDQVRSGVEPEESAARATGTAGSAVMFAGVTVLIALIGLAFAGIPFLTTMGIAAAVAVAIAVLIAVTLTPAFLGFVKGRVRGWGGRRRKTVVERATKERDETPGEGSQTEDAPTRAAGKPARRGFAARWVGLTTKHPVVTTLSVVITLGVLAIPAASLALALPNAGMLPKENEARQTYDLISEHFGPGFNGPLIMTGTIVTSNDPLTLMKDLKSEIEKMPGVAKVPLATPNKTADTGLIQIIPTTAPDDPKTADLVRELRAKHDHFQSTYDVDLKVTGFTAVAIDISDRLGAALLPFGVFVVGLSLVLLAIVFRSIWVPLKAAAGYLLSVLAAFGIVSAVFIWGWGADFLGVAKVGPIISFMPIILMGVLFGLAMDYEVFLVSRMREDFVHARRAAGGVADRTLAVDAVRSGYRSSARVVTAAAVIMFGVFASFVPEGDANLKPIALGLAAGIAIDAFLVRMTLVPAVMTLLGTSAWWMPKRLARILPHFDIEGEAVERELAHADWPEPDTTAMVAADALELVDHDEVCLYRDVTVRVDPGEALVLTGTDARAARALALTLAGRVAPTGGIVKVEGHLLPERGPWVRRRVALALLNESTDPVADLRRAVRGRAELLVVDGLDVLATSARRDQAAAVLRDAGRPLTVVGTATDVAAAHSVLAEAGHPDSSVLEVSAAAPVRTSDTAEVNA